MMRAAYPFAWRTLVRTKVTASPVGQKLTKKWFAPATTCLVCGLGTHCEVVVVAGGGGAVVGAGVGSGVGGSVAGGAVGTGVTTGGAVVAIGGGLVRPVGGVPTPTVVRAPVEVADPVADTPG